MEEYKLELSFPLDSHNTKWAKLIAEDLLAMFKDLKQIIDVTLKFSPYIRAGRYCT